jgi:endoglucanase
MGGIDDRILPAQKVTVFTRKGQFPGIIGSKPPHIQKEEERRLPSNTARAKDYR